jgi:hypothetical protein
MKSGSWLVPCIAAALLLAGSWFVVVGPSGAQEPGTAKRSDFMRLKLQPVKDILEGIALEDYDRITQSAERVHLLSLDESWMVMQTDEYRQQSDEFRRAVKIVVDNSRARNIDGVTLGYMQMTLNCVRCHRQLRTKD